MLILASASPRRKEILTQAAYEFQASPANIPEIRLPNENPTAFATRLAREKAQFVFAQRIAALHPGEEPLLVLGADTIVVTAEEILGKPHSAVDAARMLRALSGRSHRVITGVCLISKDSVELAAETTTVEVNPITEAEIAAYVATGEPMDKAAAYAIQGYAARWIPRIQGCYFNVVGLPIARVASMIEGEKLRHAPAAELQPDVL